ncbi:MAG: hypothetical protein SGJ20_16870, partial [Planctomycetota bacterium]|nr:hypothetical protein [Planctomycetota bacterium]
HYNESIRPAVMREWERFRQFLQRHELGMPAITQCEVTYVNHLEIGKGWKSLADLPDVFSGWSGRTSGRFLPVPESVTLNVRYMLPDKKGRLRISASPAIRREDAIELIHLELTARGYPGASDDKSVFEWIDMGREWIVRGFTDFTSEKMHAVWSRTQ